jgi:hypothetical protein
MKSVVIFNLKNMFTLNEKEKVTIPVSEYNLLKEVYNQFKKQALLFRIIETERNLKSKKVKKTSIDEFIKKI